MKEGSKTAIFAAIAGVVALLAWLTTARNVTDTADAKGKVGKVLFEKFTDPVDAASLKIVKYDTTKEALSEFEVSKDKNGVWSIPSHESYPADAAKQMADAATLFVNLKVLDVASEKQSEQKLYGVLEPNKQKEEEGGDGVGMLVQLRDEKGTVLTDVIIGKESDKNKRFLRIPSEDPIYVCEINTAPITTDFKAWIEPDLLKLSSNDIETLGIRDYQIVPTQQGLALSRNYEADLVFATSNGQWNAAKLVDFSGDQPTEKQLAPNEQLNSLKLNEIKNALDNLKIADVRRKPTGLAADLKGDKSKLGNDALASLARRGFFPNPAQKEGDVVDFFSKNGELQVTLKDGVQYLLRFGSSASAEVDETAKVDGKDGFSINPYMLVTVRLDESKHPMPALEKVPETVDELKSMESLKEATSDINVPPPSGTMPTQEPPTAIPGEQPETPADDSAKPADDSVKPEQAEEASKQEDAPKSDSDSEDKAAAPTETPSSDQSSIRKVGRGKLVSFQEEDKTKAETKAESNAAQDSPAAQPTVPAAASADQDKSELTDEEWKERLEAARERIQKANTRRIEEREEKLKAAKSKVAELNRKFADWYYVISEADYNRLRISMKDLIQPKGPAANSPVPGLPGGGFPGSGGAFPPLGQE